MRSHAHAHVCIAQDPGIRVQDIANRVAVTMRVAQSIVPDTPGDPASSSTPATSHLHSTDPPHGEKVQHPRRHRHALLIESQAGGEAATRTLL